MKPSEIQALVQFAQLGLRIVSERMLTIMGMAICAGLFAWVLYAPDLTRLAGAVLFAVIVYLPLVRMEQAKKQQPPQGDDQ